MNKQQKRNQLVLERLIEMYNADKNDGDTIGDALEFMLDDLAENDFFGTEGQSDLRGDQRDNKTVYTMWYVDWVDA